MFFIFHFYKNEALIIDKPLYSVTGKQYKKKVIWVYDTKKYLEKHK